MPLCADQFQLAEFGGVSEAVSDWAILAVHLGPPLSLLSRISERSSRRSEPFTARTVLRSSTRGKGVALNGPLKWPSRSQPLTLDWARDHLSYTKSLQPVA